MKINILFILQLFYSLPCLLAQNRPIQIAIDAFGNRYEVFQENIKKYDASGGLLFTNGFPQMGLIDHLDITNPLQPCIFFFDTQKILSIDNTLSSQNTPIDLSQKLHNGVLPYYTAGCVSANGGFWCFDNIQKKIIRMDVFGQTLFELANLNAYHPMASWNILWMQESKNQLFLRDENHLHCFDFTGSYLQSIHQPFYPSAASKGNVFELNPTGLYMVYPTKMLIPIHDSTTPPFTIANGNYYDFERYLIGVNIQEFVNK